MEEEKETQGVTPWALQSQSAVHQQGKEETIKEQTEVKETFGHILDFRFLRLVQDAECFIV